MLSNELKGSNKEALEALPFKAQGFELIQQTPDLRVVVFTLAHGQEVPWHFHTEITDTFFCLEGSLVIQHGDNSVHDVNVGESHVIPPGVHHRVRGQDGGSCRFLLVQGVGQYDFVPVDRS